MTHYSAESRHQIFVKGYGFLSFAENMGTNIGKNISKSLSRKYNQNVLDHVKQSVTDTLKTVSKRAILKTAEANDDLTGNKITDTITKVSKSSPYSPLNNSEHKVESIINKYLKKNIYHQKTDKKLLMI